MFWDSYEAKGREATIKWVKKSSIKLYTNRLSVNHKITYLDGVVPKATDYLLIIVLETINTFTVFWATLNPLQVVSAASPISLNCLWRWKKPKNNKKPLSSIKQNRKKKVCYQQYLKQLKILKCVLCVERLQKLAPVRALNLCASRRNNYIYRKRTENKNHTGILVLFLNIIYSLGLFTNG